MIDKYERTELLKIRTQIDTLYTRLTAQNMSTEVVLSKLKAIYTRLGNLATPLTLPPGDTRVHSSIPPEPEPEWGQETDTLDPSPLTKQEIVRLRELLKGYRQ